MNKLNYWMTTAACSALGAVSALAQGQSNPVDLSEAETAVDNIKEAVTGLITGKVVGAVVAIVGACVVIWAIPRVWRWLRGAAR